MEPIVEQVQTAEKIKHRLLFSLVTQGNYKFYTLTIDSDILAKSCYVTTRYEDPFEGFQRTLDQDRAQKIADYIDSGMGTIPNSIILSAQSDAELTIVQRRKALEFVESPKSFLIIDGQHRVFGFALAKSKVKLRVPVVIYEGLSRKDESRLFIDINTKQRPVPNELLLDIKKLADYENDIEQKMRQIFDLFYESNDSPLLGLLSPSEKSRGKLTRVPFNKAIQPLVMNIFQDREIEEIYDVIRSYLEAFLVGMRNLNVEEYITKPTVFRSVLQFFKEIAQRVKDKYGSNYSVDNFYEIMKPVFDNAKSTWFSNAKTQSLLSSQLSGAMQRQFTL